MAKYGELFSDHVSLVSRLRLEQQTGQASAAVNDQSNLVMLTRLCSSIGDDQFWLIKISFSVSQKLKMELASEC